MIIFSPEAKLIFPMGHILSIALMPKNMNIPEDPFTPYVPICS